MGKGEIARYEQFLLFPQCFQKACFPGASKGVVVSEWVNIFANTNYKTIVVRLDTLYDLMYAVQKEILREEEMTV